MFWPEENGHTKKGRLVRIFHPSIGDSVESMIMILY